MQNNLYLNFLQASKELSDKFNNLNIDPICKLILEEIALGVARNKLLKVTEVKRSIESANGVEICKLFKFAFEYDEIFAIVLPLINEKLISRVLENAGLIKIKTSSIDRRTKFLTITDSCKEYFSALSQTIDNVKYGPALN